jgi:hypothetical protein
VTAGEICKSWYDETTGTTIVFLLHLEILPLPSATSKRKVEMASVNTSHLLKKKRIDKASVSVTQELQRQIENSTDDFSKNLQVLTKPIHTIPLLSN